MKRVRIRGGNRNYHERDCERIVEVLEKNGYQASITDAQTLWEKHSEMYEAGWLHLPEDDDDIWRAVKYHIEDDEPETEENEDDEEELVAAMDEILDEE